MDQTLELAVQNAKSLAGNIRLALIVWSIFAAIISAFLGLWQHKVNKQVEKLSAEQDIETVKEQLGQIYGRLTALNQLILKKENP